MIRNLMRVGGGTTVHVKESLGKPLCDDRVFSGVIASWEGDTSEITCQECLRLVGGVRCLICGGPCRQDPVEGLIHQFEPDSRHAPKVPNPFTEGQDANQAAARIVRETTGD